MGKQVINVVLNTEADKDILRWLARQENRSAAIREAIRSHIGGGGVTIADVYEAVKKLERKIESGAVVIDGGGDPLAAWGDEHPDLVAALGRLGDL